MDGSVAAPADDGSDVRGATARAALRHRRLRARPARLDRALPPGRRDRRRAADRVGPPVAPLVRPEDPRRRPAAVPPRPGGGARDVVQRRRVDRGGAPVVGQRRCTRAGGGRQRLDPPRARPAPCAHRRLRRLRGGDRRPGGLDAARAARPAVAVDAPPVGAPLDGRRPPRAREQRRLLAGGRARRCRERLRAAADLPRDARLPRADRPRRGAGADRALGRACAHARLLGRGHGAGRRTCRARCGAPESVGRVRSRTKRADSQLSQPIPSRSPSKRCGSGGTTRKRL